MEKLKRNLQTVQAAIRELDSYQRENVTIEDSFFFIARSAIQTCEMRLKKRILMLEKSSELPKTAEKDI